MKRVQEDYQEKPTQQDWYGNEKKIQRVESKKPVKSFAPLIPAGDALIAAGKKHHIGKFQPMVAKFPPNAPRTVPVMMSKKANGFVSKSSTSSFDKPSSKKKELTLLPGYPPLSSNVRFPSRQGT